ncbi:MAG: glycoside hydrolase family 27 protein [Chloroflexi bacterium]|nr:glycoside hydrolase family 27 protein [Chloroflexota bacterium]
MTIAQTPPMGWNSWNVFGAEITAETVMGISDAFIETGLADAGYEYIVVDDFWHADQRVNGRLMWDEDKFPDGIRPVADYVHSKGLKFGIYSCAGSHTCGGKPASFGYEEVDAQTFAEWEVDFLKYDYCYVPPGVDATTLYQRMGQALRATGRPILYSICEWGSNHPWLWGSKVGGHCWRTTGDIDDSWESIVDIGFIRQKGLDPYAGVGHWNDPDMLVVGMYGSGNPQVAKGGCTDIEYRTHFSLWCLLAAPLMIGCDVRNMNQATRDILLNPAAIAINQDALGRTGYFVGETLYAYQSAEVWAKPLAGGSLAVGLFNLGDMQQRRITVAWESIGLHPQRACDVYDVWRDETIGGIKGSFTAYVDSHDVALLRITPQP